MGAGNSKEHIQTQLIVEAIQHAEALTSGEIRVHLCKSPDVTDGVLAAKEAFQALGMHRTQERNGIIFYLNRRKHLFAFFGDEGIHQKVGQSFWDHLRDTTQEAIRSQSLTDAVVSAVLELGKVLGEHFPRKQGDQNELSNEVTHSD